MIIRRTLAAVLVLAAPAMSGCALQGLDFRADTRLTITAPPDRATVVVPFPLTWTLDDPRPSESGFAVLVDVDPPAPGRAMTTLLPEAQQGAACDADCQQKALSARGVTLTRATSLLVSTLPHASGVPEEQARRHRITVVVVDDDGRRVGEVSASVTVDEERP